MGRVVQLIPGNDGRIRQVVLKTSNGLGRYSVKLLYPLEIQSTHTGVSVDHINAQHTSNSELIPGRTTAAASNAEEDVQAQHSRPRRQAAERQRQLMKDLVQAESL